MSVDDAGRPDADEELAAAYACAQALADDGRGPSAAVRAGVLAAAAEVASGARARVAADAAPPRVPVAPPMAAVGRTRGRAVNVSSWRVRAGAAVCAALLVAVMSWRSDESGRLHGDVQVALAEMKRVAPPQSVPPQDLPAQAPLPTVDDALARAQGVANANGKPSAREPDQVVAQADSRELAPPPQADVPVRARRADERTAVHEPPAPVEPDSKAVDADVPRVAAAAPPSPVPAPTSDVSPAAPQGETRVATAQPDAPVLSGARLGAVSRKASSSPGGRLVSASARLVPAPLQSAAERGDVEALKALLADPATRVDAPDPAGRTALLHAVLAQRLDVVRLLVAAGADPDRADATGLTPRAAAQAGSNAAIAAALAAPPP